MKICIAFIFALMICLPAEAQLKFIVEDFEGLADGTADLKANGLFTYGMMSASISSYPPGADHQPKIYGYAGSRYLELKVSGEPDFGGAGKGISLFAELNATTDHLNFYLRLPPGTEPGNRDSSIIKIELQDDDNADHAFSKTHDDAWICRINGKNTGRWELISIPLKAFEDETKGGDGFFNINYKQGKLLSLVFSFENFTGIKNEPGSLQSYKAADIDFICFSDGKLLTGKNLFEPPGRAQGDFCLIGAWSKEGNNANFSEIASGFEKHFHGNGDSVLKKLGIVHFFQPFGVEGEANENLYPSVNRINDVIAEGYMPMITLENHFVKTDARFKQPNLYSILEGHFDTFFAEWAKEIKQVNGTVLLRILHEFNGDWYPWCIANNDKNPEIFIRAYRHIHSIFKLQNATNVKFIWCPNSMSIPQESWNYIMDAYPGDAYVDFLGMDIYNGAGKGTPVWRSFRKEAIENYFILTAQLPSKPLFVCETASRERNSSEAWPAQTKAEWIEQMSGALGSDMSRVRLLTWFNEKKTFQINSSPAAIEAFSHHIMLNDYFKSGTDHLFPLLGKRER